MAADALLFSQPLSINGDGSGGFEAIGNYSAGGVGSTEFYIQPAGVDRLYIARLIIMIEDAGTFATDGYGAGGALTNGISFEIRQSNDDVVAALQNTIHSNIEWGALCYDVGYHDFGGGQANKFLLVRWTFERMGSPIILEDRQKLVMVLSDNFSGLVKHRFNIQGHFLNRSM